jgi:hypothetical protein
MAPERGWGRLCWWPLISKKNFLYLFYRIVGFDDHLTDSSVAVSCFLQSDWVLVVRLAYAN